MLVFELIGKGVRREKSAAETDHMVPKTVEGLTSACLPLKSYQFIACQLK